MSDKELLELDINTLTEEKAREIAIRLLEGDIGDDRKFLTISGVISAVLLVIMVLAGMDNVAGYVIMGIAAMFLMSFFNSLQKFIKKKALLRKIKNYIYDKGCIEFVRTCQEFVAGGRKDGKSFSKRI